MIKNLIPFLFLICLVGCSGSGSSEVGVSTDYLTVSSSHIYLGADSDERSLTITNTSSTLTVTNITSVFVGTALDGQVTETMNTCTALLPNASCTLGYTPGSTAVSDTSFTITSDNSSDLQVDMEILDLSVAQAFQGGKIASLNSDGISGLIASNSDGLATNWGTVGVVTGATSTSDGAANTIAIINAVGSSNAAGECADFEIDSADNTPCQLGNTCYNDWFLPASNQLFKLWQSKAALGGYSTGSYWTSEEANGLMGSVPANDAILQDFSLLGIGALAPGSKDNSSIKFRCVREFSYL